MSLAPEYVAHVLNENFEDAKVLFAGPRLHMARICNDIAMAMYRATASLRLAERRLEERSASL